MPDGHAPPRGKGKCVIWLSEGWNAQTDWWGDGHVKRLAGEETGRLIRYLKPGQKGQRNGKTTLLGLDHTAFQNTPLFYSIPFSILTQILVDIYVVIDLRQFNVLNKLRIWKAAILYSHSSFRVFVMSAVGLAKNGSPTNMAEVNWSICSAPASSTNHAYFPKIDDGLMTEKIINQTGQLGFAR